MFDSSSAMVTVNFPKLLNLYDHFKIYCQRKRNACDGHSHSIYLTFIEVKSSHSERGVERLQCSWRVCVSRFLKQTANFIVIFWILLLFAGCLKGHYKSKISNEGCTSCPARSTSNSTNTACNCLEGKYRLKNETGVSSAPCYGKINH